MAWIRNIIDDGKYGMITNVTQNQIWNSLMNLKAKHTIRDLDKVEIVHDVICKHKLNPV